MLFGTVKNSVLSFVLIFGLCAPVAADPVITGVSGALKQEATITITGSGFGQKDPAPPLIWADFEDGTMNPSKLGQRKSWSAPASSSRFVLTTSNQTPNSHYSVVGNYTPLIRSFSFEVSKGPEDGGWTRIYNYQKRFYDFDATGNQQFWRLSSGESSAAVFVGGWLIGEGRCYSTGEGYMGGMRGSYQGTPYEKDQWLTEEFIWQFEGGTGRNLDGTRGPGGTGMWDYTRNGRRVQHRENVYNGAIHPSRLVTDNYIAAEAPPPPGSKVFMDDIYIDDTYARVIVGNAPTLGRSNVREIQIPSAWSDTSITVTVNQGSFSDLEHVYLYVFDMNGAVNNEGYPLDGKPPRSAQSSH